MGIEMEYQAIPAGQGLIERARSDVKFGESLCSLHRLLCRRGDESDGPLWAEAHRMRAEHPGLEKRYCDLDRQWDILHYLLSATRREDPPTDDDLVIDKAFRDGEVIASHVCGGQGHLIRYVSPAEVKGVACVVSGMDEEALRVHYDPVRMEGAGVYKFWADRADEAKWSWIVTSFDDFQAFFQLVADHGEAVIVVWS